ncbi:MAG: J domain-containing protein [Thermodesulfobacteriota bacterium]
MLPEKAGLETIKASYQRLISQWHPDKCHEDPEAYREMTCKITSACETIMDYVENYQYDFSEDTVKSHRSPYQWRFETFGKDPLWTDGKNQKYPDGIMDIN